LSSYGLLYTLFGLLGFTDTVDKALMCDKGDFKHNINMQSWEWIMCTTLLCIHGNIKGFEPALERAQD
jgi:hypothetical protein